MDAAKYVGSIHHKVNDKVQAAASLNWASGASSTSLTVGAKYQIDSDTFLKVRECSFWLVGSYSNSTAKFEQAVQFFFIIFVWFMHAFDSLNAYSLKE